MISHRFKCVYVHVPKAGGQSIESVFVEQHGLTWETRAPLLLSPCNDRRFGPRFLAHLTAKEYVALGHLSQQDWDEYFTFAAIRNPWSGCSLPIATSVPTMFRLLNGSTPLLASASPMATTSSSPKLTTCVMTTGE